MKGQAFGRLRVHVVYLKGQELQVQGASLKKDHDQQMAAILVFHPISYTPYPHLVPSPILGLANAPIVETKFLELVMSLLDF